MGLKAPRFPRLSREAGLLAPGEEPAGAVPVAVDPEQAEAPAIAIVPQMRDAAVTAHERLGAESDDGVLPLLVGVLLGETEELLVERGPQTQAVHLGQHRVGRRVAVHVDVLEGDLTVLLGDGLAALDRIESLVLVVGVDVGREPLRQLLELGLDVDDRSRERRVAVGRSAPIRVAPLRLLGLPVGVGQVDDLAEGRPSSGRGQTVDSREGYGLLTDDVHRRAHEAHEEPCACLDFGNISLRHDCGPLSVEIVPRPDTMSDPRTHSFRSGNKHLEW